MLTDLSTLLPPSILSIVQAALPRPGMFIARPITPEEHPALARRLAEKYKESVQRVALTLADVYDDARNVIRNCAARYADESHPILNADNLFSEGLAKLAELDREGSISKVSGRLAFFSYFKKTILRHLWRFVLAQKFTLKRTGIAPPPRGSTTEQLCAYRARVPVEVSLDAPLDDSGRSLDEMVADPIASLDESMQADIRELLSPTEATVFDQLIDPNYEAWVYAKAEAQWDDKTDNVRAGEARIRVRHEHMALGLCLELDLFKRLLAQIQTKVKLYMQTGEAFSNEHGPTLRKLEALFDLRHIPRSVDVTVIRRIMTIAARDQHQKVTPAVARMLEEIGAKAPQLQSHTLSCFGVLFQRNHRMCAACGLRAACSVEASNVGLGEVTLSPALLGTKTTRIPAIVAGPRPENPVFEEEKMEEIYAFLSENFYRVVIGGEHYFRHHGGWEPKVGVTLEGNAGLIYHIQGQKLRFCKPGPMLMRKLRMQRSNHSSGESYFLPPEATANEAIELILQHAKETVLEPAHASSSH